MTWRWVVVFILIVWCEGEACRFGSCPAEKNLAANSPGQGKRLHSRHELHGLDDALLDAEAAVLDAAEGAEFKTVTRDLVDVHGAGFDVLHRFDGGLHIAGDDTAGETVRRRVGKRDGV